MEDPLRAPFNFARAGMMFNASAVVRATETVTAVERDVVGYHEHRTLTQLSPASTLAEESTFASINGGEKGLTVRIDDYSTAMDVFDENDIDSHGLDIIRKDDVLVTRAQDQELSPAVNITVAKDVFLSAEAEAGIERDEANMTMYGFQLLPENKHILHRFGNAMKAMGDFAPQDAILSGTCL